MWIHQQADRSANLLHSFPNGSFGSLLIFGKVCISVKSLFNDLECEILAIKQRRNQIDNCCDNQ